MIERHAEIDRAIGDSFGARLWKKNFLWRDRVLWREFAPAFYSALSLPIPSDPEESVCSQTSVLEDKIALLVPNQLIFHTV